jgi:hypothetical protein
MTWDWWDPPVRLPLVEGAHSLAILRQGSAPGDAGRSLAISLVPVGAHLERPAVGRPITETEAYIVRRILDVRRRKDQARKSCMAARPCLCHFTYSNHWMLNVVTEVRIFRGSDHDQPVDGVLTIAGAGT